MIQPPYQRREFWNTSKKISLIESVFLGLPLPLIYLARTTHEVGGEDVVIREVVDGQQRLTALRDFFNNELTIPDDSIVSDLQGKTFRELSQRLKQDFKGFSLSTATIPQRSRVDKFELFRRLNQRSTVLSDQELRNAAYHGEYLDQLKTKAESIRELMRVSDAEWNRMKDVEYLTRLAAFERRGFNDFPNKRLNKFLNDEMGFGAQEGEFVLVLDVSTG